MTPRSVVLSVLLLLFVLRDAWCNLPCRDNCCGFVESFPVRLRRLRADFAQIRDYYEANDDLDTALLDESIEETFKSQFGCHAVGGVLNFYLTTVLPSALAGVPENNQDLKPHMESIQLIFDELKRDVTRCRNYFSCKKPFDISNLNSTYTEMDGKGLYKAMGELDILFNYIETYMASKRHGNQAASV